MSIPIKKIEVKKHLSSKSHAEKYSEEFQILRRIIHGKLYLFLYFCSSRRLLHPSIKNHARFISVVPSFEEIRQSVLSLNEHVGASNNFDIFIDTKEEEGVFEPELLAKIDKFQSSVQSLCGGKSRVGFTNSLSLDIIKRVHEEQKLRVLSRFCGR